MKTLLCILYSIWNGHTHFAHSNIWLKKTWTNHSSDTILQFVQVFFWIRRCKNKICVFFVLTLFIAFRDTGISLQIQMYQLYSEFFVFAFAFLFSFLVPSQLRKMVSIVTSFIVFVVQPLFYLHGDPSFRNRIMNQGLQGIWQALKKELF